MFSVSTRIDRNYSSAEHILEDGLFGNCSLYWLNHVVGSLSEGDPRRGQRVLSDGAAERECLNAVCMEKAGNHPHVQRLKRLCVGHNVASGRVTQCDIRLTALMHFKMDFFKK